jgi:hypothetical protein
VIELYLLDAKQPTPVRFIPQTILERPLRVLLSDEELYRSGS